MIELSSDQNAALKTLKTWYLTQPADRKPFVTLGGYAGTGKTTLLAYLRHELEKAHKNMSVAFCSFTGKATQVLRKKLDLNEAKYKNDNISTIHSLIYKTIEDSAGRVLGWELRDKKDVEFDLIIVDEASMLDAKLWQDLLSFRVPIIAVGDHGQLPPIQGGFNLMDNPELKLQQIHRQAEENPIIQVSIMARENGFIPPRNFGKGVHKFLSDEAGDEIDELINSYKPDTIILCGYNSTRVKINSAVRMALGFETVLPCAGDRVICLRNNHKKRIFNGMLGTIERIKLKTKDKYETTILLEGGTVDQSFEGLISVEQFNSPKTLNNLNLTGVRIRDADLFDFGYALTVHKAQGSQARKVAVFEERFANMSDDMWRRWLYTAVTRAEEELVVFGGGDNS